MENIYNSPYQSPRHHRYTHEADKLFQRQLVSHSFNLPYQPKRQKFLNVNHRKYQLEHIKQKIYDRCIYQEMQFINLLKKQRNQLKEVTEKLVKVSENNNKVMRDVIDQLQQKKYIPKREAKVQSFRTPNYKNKVQKSDNTKQFQMQLQSERGQVKKQLPDQAWWIKKVQKQKAKKKNRPVNQVFSSDDER